MPTFVLASSSPRRRELLSSLGIEFTVRKPDIDETQYSGEAPLTYVTRLSQEKAASVIQQLDLSATVLAADTVVVLGADTLGINEQGEVLGKPTDADDARRMLKSLRGRVHQVCTSLTLVASSGQSITRLTRTDVTMRDYTDAEIEAYIMTGDPFDKAGSYAIQHPVFRPVAHLEGCYTNVVGLPICTLKNALVEIGWPGIQPQDVCNCRELYSGVLG